MSAAGTAFAGDSMVPSTATPHVGASIGRRLGGWRPTGSGPNTLVAAGSPELVRRSRDLRRNNPHAKRAMDLLPAHIVGSGIKPRSACPNRKVRDALTQLWNDWVDVADADGTLNFYGLQALAVSEMVEGGETFARMRTRRMSDGLPVPLQIQLLPVEQVPLYWSQINGPNSVVQAIERNPIGQRVAYWVYPVNPGDYVAGMLPVNLQPNPIPAADVAHLYRPDRVGQLRGLPWLSAAIATLQQIDRYMDAELLRKQMVAALVGFVTKAPGEDVDAAGLAAQFGAVVPDGEDLPTVAMEPGTMQYLDQGEDVKFSAPADVGGNFAAFLAANHRSIAASANVLYEELTGDWSNTNDRVFRAQFNTFKRMVGHWQYNLAVHQFCRPIWERFVDYAASSGAVKVPKSLTDIELKRCDWMPQRHDYINPVQDIEATGLEMGLGLTSRSKAAASRGDDVEQIDEQVAADRAREQNLGLIFGGGLSKATASPNFGGVAAAEGQDPGNPGARTASASAPAPAPTPANAPKPEPAAGPGQ